MHDFKDTDGQLYCEQVPVARIAKAVGTPCYIYSHHTLVDHFVKIQKAFTKGYSSRARFEACESTCLT